MCDVSLHPFLIPVVFGSSLLLSQRELNAILCVFHPLPSDQSFLRLGQRGPPKANSAEQLTQRVTRTAHQGTTASLPSTLCAAVWILTHPWSVSVPLFSLPDRGAIVGSPQDGLQEDAVTHSHYSVDISLSLVHLTFFLSCLVHEDTVPNLGLRPEGSGLVFCGFALASRVKSP